MSLNKNYQNQQKRRTDALKQHQKDRKVFFEQLEHENTQYQNKQRGKQQQQQIIQDSSSSSSSSSSDSEYDSSSDSDDQNPSEFSVTIADTIADILVTLDVKKYDKETQRSLFLNKLQNLAKYKVLTQPPVKTKNELHERLVEGIKALEAIYLLVEIDDDLYRYTQDTLNILKPQPTVTTIESNDPVIAEFLKPLIKSQRNGPKKKDNQEILRLNSELTKVNKLLLSTLNDKIASEKMNEEITEDFVNKAAAYEKQFKKSLNTVKHLRSVNDAITQQMQDLNTKCDELLKEKTNEIELLLTEVNTLKETINPTKTCVVCTENRPLSVCVPCGHTFCASCIASFKLCVCAICRVKVTQSVVVYYS